MGIITITNHKGGVGKTTTAVNLASGISRNGLKVLLIDLDAQSNTTQALRNAYDGTDIKDNIYTVLTADTDINKAVIPINDNFSIITSTLDLSGAELELASVIGREFILKERIANLKTSYDYIIIDSPPSLGLLTLNAIVAANRIIIPLQAEYFALQGLAKLDDIIKRIEKSFKQQYEVEILVTRYDNRKVINRQIIDAVKAQYKVFKTVIRENITLSEAQATGIDVISYYDKCNGSKDYLALAKEVIKTTNNKETN